MKEKDVSFKVTIKGSLLFFDKSLFFMFFSFSMIVMLLYQFAFTDVVNTKEKLNSWGFSVVFLFCFAGLMYLFARPSFYFYELTDDKLIVKNLMKKYLREYTFEKIAQINLYGNLEAPLVYSNSIAIMYVENGVEQYHRYYSSNLGRSHWITLITQLHNSGVRLEDPNKEFFRSSEFQLPN